MKVLLSFCFRIVPSIVYVGTMRIFFLLSASSISLLWMTRISIGDLNYFYRGFFRVNPQFRACKSPIPYSSIPNSVLVNPHSSMRFVPLFLWLLFQYYVCRTLSCFFDVVELIRKTPILVSNWKFVLCQSLVFPPYYILSNRKKITWYDFILNRLLIKDLQIESSQVIF